MRLLVRRDRVSVVCDERFNMWITANSHKVFSRFKNLNGESYHDRIGENFQKKVSCLAWQVASLLL